MEQSKAMEYESEKKAMEYVSEKASSDILTLILSTWKIWWAPNASKWQMGFKFGKIMGMNKSTFIHRNSINLYPANVENMVSS